MSEVEDLVKAYERFVRLPWEQGLAGPQKVWFAIYDPAQERRLRLHVPEFETATKNAGHAWTLLDLTDSFAKWMAGKEYREAYFKQPERMELALTQYGKAVAAEVSEALKAADHNSVVALVGLASLFGLTRSSALFEAVAPEIRGRLLAFFPGHQDGSNYRLLDARDGWNYLAVPISASNGM